MPYKTYEAFGEEKNLHAWAKDPRCIVGFHTLRARVLRDGMDIEAAMAKTAVPGSPKPDKPGLHPIVAALKAERRRQGLTIKQVGERAGMPKDRLNSYELGRVRTPLDAAVAWARALGLRIELVAPDGD